jgi:hypothetical protein
MVIANYDEKGTGPSYIRGIVKPFTSAHPLRSVTATLRRPGFRSTKSQLFALLAAQGIAKNMYLFKPKHRIMFLFEYIKNIKHSDVDHQICATHTTHTISL